EIEDAADLDAFFADIAQQISGKRYLYLRAACPVDIEVTYNGETLRSTADGTRDRSSFGTITYEDIEGSDDRVKVLRVEEGPAYDVKFYGYADGSMKCTFGLVDDEGDYTDLREFDVEVSNRMAASMTLERAEFTTMQIDENGDGQYDLVLKAASNGIAREVDNSESAKLALAACGLMALASGCMGIALSVLVRRSRS
ncbi:MAG: hypothetical protein IJ125_00450, partial [Atopobiaceae bacterium]|nr:hypothetical protein [Atopobiaceae bacterium]